MIRYSHVSLIILCETIAVADSISVHLQIKPSRVREDKTQSWSEEHGHKEKITYAWMLDSPKSATDGDPTARLYALAELIEPFGEKLLTLDAKFKRWIDVLYHVAPQHPHGITGEFDWLRMPATLMKRLANLNLDVSYEAFWFNHPDWVSPQNRNWLKRTWRKIRGRKNVSKP